MKKFLLSLAAVACAATMSATSYTVFDIANPGTWTGGVNGFTSAVTVNGKTFTISSNKADSTSDCISPDSNQYAWRVYKGSKLKVESGEVSMKQVVITYDDYTYQGADYISACPLSSGWTGSLSGAVYTCTSNGLSSFEMQAVEKQVRVKTIVVSDVQGETPDVPQTPDGVIYQNAFDVENSIADWSNIYNEAYSGFSGWYVNKSIKCIVCNSYNSADSKNYAANCKLQKEFDLTNYVDCSLSIEQAFGFDFPQSQVDNYRLYVINGGATDYLTFASYPAAPETGNWSKFAENEFDLSEYDGSKITIGFEYVNDGSKSRAWELKNFVLKGTTGVGVASIAVDEDAAPVYYNLQGVRVANPENGIFIVVKGSNVTKVVR